MVYVLLLYLMGTLPMSIPNDGPMFAPDFFETGSGALWRHDYDEPLVMNDWFLAGPGPGIERADWIQAALRWRKRALAGTARYLHLVSDGGKGWLRLAAPLSKTLDLRGGDDIFLSVTLRHVTGSGRLRFTLKHPNPSQDAVMTSYLDIPGDGEWHNLSLSLSLDSGPEAAQGLLPELCLESTDAEQEAQADLAGVIIGIDDTERMQAFGEMLRNLDTTHVCRCVYDRDDLDWTAATFTSYFFSLYDQRFYDSETGYDISGFLDTMRQRFGKLDTVILSSAYPQIGLDDRNQFDFFNDLPGGMEALKDMCRRFHEEKVRVLIPYLPWDQGTSKDEDPEATMAALVSEIEADGIFLDSLQGASSAFRQLVDAQRAGVALVPELNPPVRQLSLCNMSWMEGAQDTDPPGMPLLKWIEPRHIQYVTTRWEPSRQAKIESAFFNGIGMQLWENVFGTANPISDEDALLWKRCAAILHQFPEVFISHLWDPFYPSVQEEVLVHRWPGSPTTLFTLYNTEEPMVHVPLLRWQFPEDRRSDNMHVYDLWKGCETRWEMTEFGRVQIWGDIDRISCIAVVFGNEPRLEELMQEQAALAAEKTTTTKVTISPVPKPAPESVPPTDNNAGMVLIQGGEQRMQLRHPRSEYGCYPDPGTEADDLHRFTGFPSEQPHISHEYTVELADFWIDEAQVSNGDYKRFLEESGYEPDRPENFLRHWPDRKMPEEIAELPVVNVDLDDARAYARWAGKRLPTEAEWQRAAQGEDGRLWPWGDRFDAGKCAPSGAAPMTVRSLPEGRGPNGLYHCSGNVWEWTESEYEDAFTRFCIIRGGASYQAQGSDRYRTGGAQPLNHHEKFLLLWPGLDRCATVGFRCVKDSR
jgi:iron(II)-dependent oxidoreductase